MGDMTSTAVLKIVCNFYFMPQTILYAKEGTIMCGWIALVKLDVGIG